jgi:hypothetical protein
MADTIIANVPSAQDTGDGIMMNIILAIIFAAIAVGVVMMYQNGVFEFGSAEPETTNINVTVPTPTPTPTPAPKN